MYAYPSNKMKDVSTKRLCTEVTGQLADTPTRGLPTRGLDDSRTRHLADAAGEFACLVFVCCHLLLFSYLCT